MSKTNKIFQKTPVKIQNRSGFDMSHYNLGTLKCGTLIPVLSEPLAPGDKVSLGVLAQLDMPPLASNFYGRVDFKMETFFVPYRILMQQWKKFMTYKNNQWDATDVSSLYKQLPKIYMPFDETGPGSLADYLGYKRPSEATSASYVTFPNPLPVLAYHMIYDHWYRDKILQKPVFVEEVPETVGAANRLRCIPYISLPNIYNGSQSVRYINSNVEGDFQTNSTFNDGVKLWQLRQRNYHKDYFTSATPTPQAGDPAQLVFTTTAEGTVDEQEGTVTTSGTGSFTIAALRAANSLQKFIERNNLAGDDYADQIQANFGVRPSDAAINYPLYLGSQSYNVYNRSVYQTSNDASAVAANPFSSVGTEFGKASSMGSGSMVDSFEATEFGILMTIGSLVPHSFYSTGTRRYLFANELSDFPIPLLASVGDQPIYQGELASDSTSPFSKTTFGYAGRYSEAKFHNDEVHGILRDGESLEHFAVQRSFEVASVELGSDFIKIPTTAMDQVMAASTGLSNFTAWYQLYFEFHKSAELPVYSVPTLGEDPDTHTELIDKGGKRL